MHQLPNRIMKKNVTNRGKWWTSSFCFFFFLDWSNKKSDESRGALQFPGPLQGAGKLAAFSTTSCGNTNKAGPLVEDGITVYRKSDWKIPIDESPRFWEKILWAHEMKLELFGKLHWLILYMILFNHELQIMSGFEFILRYYFRLIQW